MAQREQDIRKFERAARQRLDAADFLLENAYALESVYLAGYAVECALKALILRRTPRREHASMIKRLTGVGSKGHDFEYLKGIVRKEPIRCAIPPAVGEMIGRVQTWSTGLRYEVGLLEYEEASAFLEAAKQIMEWAERS